MSAKLILEAHQADTNQTWTYELGDASLMTDLMRGIVPSARYYTETPGIGSVLFTFKVENGDTPEQMTIDEANQSEADHYRSSAEDTRDHMESWQQGKETHNGEDEDGDGYDDPDTDYDDYDEED